MRLILFFLLMPLLSFSHGGRTDSNGCHNDYANDDFHCHHGCPPHYHDYGCDYDYEDCDTYDGYYDDDYYIPSSGDSSFFVDNILLILLGCWVLFLIVNFLSGIIQEQREKQRKIEKESLELANRRKIYHYLKRKQYNQNDEYISNQLAADEKLQYNELKKEFEPKSKTKPETKPETKPQKKQSKLLLLWQKIEYVLEVIFFFFDFEWLKYRWARIFLRIIFYPFYFFLYIMILLLILGSPFMIYEWLFK
tara:strand:+ start:170 stop:919 length:750 start_codon:yes stop_codon:yes gene_type:complete